jgi:hypothetical protein
MHYYVTILVDGLSETTANFSLNIAYILQAPVFLSIIARRHLAGSTAQWCVRNNECSAKLSGRYVHTAPLAVWIRPGMRWTAHILCDIHSRGF